MNDNTSLPVTVTPADVALERRVTEAIATGASLPRWGWPLPSPYNGATGQERVAGWQLVHLAEQLGWLVRPRSCSICQESRRLHLHTENYFRPMRVRPVCQTCHFCLHRRFRSPDRWLTLIAKVPASGKWAARILLTELTREAAICSAARPDHYLSSQAIKLPQAISR